MIASKYALSFELWSGVFFALGAVITVIGLISINSILSSTQTPYTGGLEGIGENLRNALISLVLGVLWFPLGIIIMGVGLLLNRIR